MYRYRKETGGYQKQRGLKEGEMGKGVNYMVMNKN